jgi:predicted lactoylglutathione lyase
VAENPYALSLLPRHRGSYRGVDDASGHGGRLAARKETTMQKTIFVNLPVRDLAGATRFYEAIGCRRNPQFSDDRAASMIWSETITIQLLTREFFGSFTAKPVADGHGACGVMLALSHDSRAHVDATLDAAAAAGGRADVRQRLDMGWLYNRAVEDPDGHVLELIWMDAAAMTSARTEAAHA